MNKINLIPVLFFAVSALSCVFDSHSVAMASDNVETQIQDAGTDVKTATKKAVRTIKRGIRKATGHDTAKEDAVDHVNDSIDHVEGSLEKISHH